MASLGFRRPQFSEDVAWLPGWLQNSQTTTFNKLTTEGTEGALVKLSEWNFDEGKSGEDGHYKNCCLMLSGASSSAVSHQSPSSSVLHFHLNLSSDSNLPNPQSQPVDQYRTETPEPYKLPSSQKASEPFEVPCSLKLSKSCKNAGTPSLFRKPLIKRMRGLRPKHKDSSVGLCMKRLKDKPHRDKSLRHAVELSVAASEALHLHELLMTEVAPETLPASSLLEVCLKVNQTRLQWVEDISLKTDQFNESPEDLSDLVDSVMVDAFEDVGLYASSYTGCLVSNSFMSHVKESPLTDLKADNESGPTTEMAVDNTSGKKSEENQDMVLKSPAAVWIDDECLEMKLRVDESFVNNFDRASSPGTLELHKSIQGHAETFTTELKFGFELPESHPHQPHFNANSFHSNKYAAPETYEQDDCAFSGLNRCLLGGWTQKDESNNLIMDYFKYTAKARAVEISSLSESADCVPDKSSYVDEHTSIAATDIGDKGLLNSEEIVRNSNSLSMDPLCSAVPCSIFSGTPESFQNEELFQDDGKRLIDQDFVPISRHLPETLNLTSESNVEVQTVLRTDDKDSDFKVQKQLATLKRHSAELPSQNTKVMEPSHVDQFSLKCKNICYGKSNKDTCPTSDQTTNHQSCKNTPNKWEGFLTIQQEQGPPNFQIKGVYRLQLANGLDEEDNPQCSVWGRVADDIQLQKKTLVSGLIEQDIPTQPRKHVHFKEEVTGVEQSKQFQKRKFGGKCISTSNRAKKLRTSNWQPEGETYSQEVKWQLTNCRLGYGVKLIFRGIDFLLTGFSTKKERDVEALIIQHGGIVLSDIPSPNFGGKSSFKQIGPKLPVVLSSKKVQTIKFLYGCAVNACILKAEWLYDSVLAGSVIQPEKYMIVRHWAVGYHARLRTPDTFKLIFDGMGIMLHGKLSFCAKLSKIFKCGGGRVFKSLHWLVQSSESKNLTGAVVAEDRSTVSRHLKYCARERSLPIMSASWIINSLHAGKVLPFMESDYDSSRSSVMTSVELPSSGDLSQEI